MTNPLTADCPDAVRAYLALTDGSDRTAATVLFSDDAQVTDDGHDYVGTAEIRKWLGGVASEYTYTTTPTAVRSDAGRTSVTCRIEGTFPGGVVDLDYHFRTDGSGRLAGLTIEPSVAARDVS